MLDRGCSSWRSLDRRLADKHLCRDLAVLLAAAIRRKTSLSRSVSPSGSCDGFGPRRSGYLHGACLHRRRVEHGLTRGRGLDSATDVSRAASLVWNPIAPARRRRGIDSSA